MGVLTHLDTFKNNKALQRTKKNLKQRFWTEVYQELPTIQLHCPVPCCAFVFSFVYEVLIKQIGLLWKKQYLK